MAKCWLLNGTGVAATSNLFCPDVSRLRQFMSAEDCSAVESQKVVAAYFPSKQLLPFGFAEHCCSLVTSSSPPFDGVLCDWFDDVTCYCGDHDLDHSGFFTTFVLGLRCLRFFYLSLFYKIVFIWKSNQAKKKLWLWICMVCRKPT